MLKLDRLLSLEDNEETTAIDRVLDKSGANDDKPLLLSSQILAARETMVKEAQEQSEEIESEESDTDDSSDDSSDDSDDSSDDSDGDDGDSEGGDSDGGDDDWDDPADDDDWDDDDEESDDEDDDEDKEEDKEDKDDKKDDKKDDDKKDDNSEESAAASWESHVDTLKNSISNEDITSNIPLPKKWNFFKSLRKVEKQRRDFLLGMGFGIEDGEGGPQLNEKELGDQGNTSVAFTKDAIVESIANLGEINKKYYDNTVIYIEKLMKSLPKIDERLMNFQRVHERGEVEFTNKMVTDVSILAHIAYDKDFNLREVLKRIKTYSKDSNDIAKLILNSPFKDLTNAFLSKSYLTKGEVLQYSKRLPGFNIASVNLPEYKNYLKTSPLEYQYYTLKENNPSEAYEIKPISITEEKDILYFVDVLKSIVLELSVSVDVLRALLVEFKKFMDELKILRVGVEEDEFEKLSELGLDDKVQTFILFKLVVEIISVNINISVECITGFMEVMDHTLKLTDIEPESESNDTDDENNDDDDNDDNEDDDTSDDDDDDLGDDDW